MKKKFILICGLAALSFAVLSCGSTSSVAEDTAPESQAVSDGPASETGTASDSTASESSSEIQSILETEVSETESTADSSPENQAVSETEVSETDTSANPASENQAVSETETSDGPAPESQAVSETETSDGPAPESQAVSETETPANPAPENQAVPEIVRKDLPENMRVGAKGSKRPVAETDPALVSVINEGKEKFIQSFFTDGEKHITIEYSLYIPENIDYEKKYPLVMYIPDASAVSKSAGEIVGQYYGADIWVTEEAQKKHQCFVFVPAFSVLAVDDNYDVSEEIEVVVTVLKNLVKNYNIDTERIYATGQSMGCMTSLYLNSKYPDLFAASLFVSGQWWKYSLSALKNANFFYIVAEGDEKASSGQSEVMDLIGKGNYAYGIWSAAESENVQDENARKMISEGRNANFIRFGKGTVLTGGGTDSKHEHDSSFTYGYRIPAVRDWLFEQKNSNSGSGILSGN